MLTAPTHSAGSTQGTDIRMGASVQLKSIVGPKQIRRGLTIAGKVSHSQLSFQVCAILKTISPSSGRMNLSFYDSALTGKESQCNTY